MPEKIKIAGPVVQLAIDVLDVDAALRVAEAGVKAGVDWLEVGTPLVTFAGTAAIGAIARAFPDKPVLADYKSMDGTRKYVLETREQGGHIATVCGVASDASVRTAVTAGRETGIAIICDLYATHDPAARAAEVEARGVDSVYVHWGSDQRMEEPRRDPLLDLTPVLQRVRLPVGVGTFSAADGARAVRMGASIVVIGMPLIQAENVESALKEYVESVKAAATLIT